MVDTEDKARDLTVLYLQKYSDETMSKERLAKEYERLFEEFKTLLTKPPSNVIVHDRNQLF